MEDYILGRSGTALTFGGKLLSRKIPLVFSLSPMTWINPPIASESSIQDGKFVWSDGEHIYFSSDNIQKVLDIPTHTWYDKEWNYVGDWQSGPKSGDDIWYDGEFFHYSGYMGAHSGHMVLDKTTSTWTTEEWYTPEDAHPLYAPIMGQNVWTDGSNIYYNLVSNVDFTWDSWILNKSTHTWTNKTWNIRSGGSFNGEEIWYDGNNIYLSYSGLQYVLNPTTSTWESKTWGPDWHVDSSLQGRNVWSNDAYIIWSWLHRETENSLLIDIENSSASQITFGGAFNGKDVWTDGNDWYVGMMYKINFPPPKMTTTRLGRASLGTMFTLLRQGR